MSDIIKARIWNRVVSNIAELQTGALALTNNVIGLARIDDTIAIKDDLGVIHYFYGSTHIGNTARAISNVPEGNITANNVQDALNQLDLLKLNASLVSVFARSYLYNQNSADTLATLGAIPLNQKGSSLGVCPLDSTSKVLAQYLPSYVDDVLEFANLASFPPTGESGKIYIANDTNLQYRWAGTSYAGMNSSLALGITSATAYRGDFGNSAYLHSQIVTGNPHGTTKADLSLGNVDNTSDANKPISSATAAALAGKASTAHTHDRLNDGTSDRLIVTSTEISANVPLYLSGAKLFKAASLQELQIQPDTSLAAMLHVSNSATQLGLMAFKRDTPTWYKLLLQANAIDISTSSGSKIALTDANVSVNIPMNIDTRVYVGTGYNHNAIYAQLSHINFASSLTGYGVMQNNVGRVYISAETATSIELNISNISKLQIANTEITASIPVLAPSFRTTGSESATTYGTASTFFELSPGTSSIFTFGATTLELRFAAMAIGDECHISVRVTGAPASINWIDPFGLIDNYSWCGSGATSYFTVRRSGQGIAVVYG